MAGAIRLQLHSRGIAAVTAVLLVVCGALASHHEATTAHVRDRAGDYLHAAALIGHHGADASDIHGQHRTAADAGDCALMTLSHQAASASVARPAIAGRPCTPRAHDLPRRACTGHVLDVFRIAPKTSPPASA